MQAMAARQRTRDHAVLDETEQYLTCGVGDEIFAMTVVQVREVLDLQPFSRMPNMPAFVRGFIDVRGKPVPVIDLRVKFGMAPAPATDKTRIVVLEVVIDGHPTAIGALADRVYEVTALDSGTMEPPPDIGTQWRSDIIRGIGRRHNRFVIVLNLNKVFTMADLSATATTAAGA